MKLFEIIEVLEYHAPLILQESYDNAGLVTGNPEMEVNQALITVDVTHEVVQEAVEKECQLIISHHPVIFKPIKKLTGSTYVEKILLEAVKNNLALYAVHTNLDVVSRGVSKALAEKLKLVNLKVLDNRQGLLKKLVTFCPLAEADRVRKALFDAGAGHIGNYDSCSFNSAGKGTFRAGDGCDPYVGEIGELHVEEEIRIETIVPVWRLNQVIKGLLQAHPYEEVAYDIYPVDNELASIGMGMVGELKQPIEELVFLESVKKITGAAVIKHTALKGGSVRKVAVCGGAGAFLTPKAIRSGAEIFITGDLKYHDFFEAEGKIVLADIGHYESEQFAKSVIHSIISEKFPNFATLLSEVNTNPISCL